MVQFPGSTIVIGAILESADYELELLTRKVESRRLRKLALMQQLLKGKITPRSLDAPNNNDLGD
jgi:hypothetical protein